MASFPPLKKKRRAYDQLGSPFPIPLAALTGVPASAANWHSYEAHYSQGIVRVLNPEHAEALWNNGYFGKGKASAQNRGSYKNNGDTPWQHRHKTWKLVEYDGLKFPKEKELEQQCNKNTESFETAVDRQDEPSSLNEEIEDDQNEKFENIDGIGESCLLDDPKEKESEHQYYTNTESFENEEFEKSNNININKDSAGHRQGELLSLNEENNDNKYEKFENNDDIGESCMSDDICKDSESFTDNGRVLLVLHSDRSGVMSNIKGEKQLEYEYQQEMDDFGEYGDGESSRPASIIDSASASLILTPEETMFLSYALGCLTLIDERKHHMSIDEMWREFVNEDIRFVARYAVYHNFRAKGWVVKPGLKFGSDWVLYPVGPPFYHAHFTVSVQCLWADTLAVDESLNWREMSWTAFSATDRLNSHVKKTPILTMVLRPRNITRNRLNHISCLKEMKIKEVILSRWNPDPNGQEEAS
ncbi:unnamed protein product [Meganyctiphanes norvegica]|uniref:tRNA-splicing endonuclease subunit Sen2 n=1 Tax=Meganyctiphanes norvegica TaxID=48144 RepID=A0AAV2R9B0_MEGNR